MDSKANKYICLQLACLILYSHASEVCGDAGALLQTHTSISKTDISSHFFEDTVLGANSLDLPQAKENSLPQAPFDVGSGAVPMPKNFHPVFVAAEPAAQAAPEQKEDLQVLAR